MSIETENTQWNKYIANYSYIIYDVSLVCTHAKHKAADASANSTPKVISCGLGNPLKSSEFLRISLFDWRFDDVD